MAGFNALVALLAKYGSQGEGVRESYEIADGRCSIRLELFPGSENDVRLLKLDLQ